MVKEFPIKAGLVRHKVGAVHAVSDVSFTVNEGETFGLVGESGCGKTTIGRMLVGLEPVTFWSDLLRRKSRLGEGHRPTEADRRERQMMFQDPYSSLDPRMKVGQILGEPLLVQKRGTKVPTGRSRLRAAGLGGPRPRRPTATLTSSPAANASASDLLARWR
jgi:ABC-type glutathione transport system ATPase component